MTKTGKKPLVSVIIPTYKRSDMLSRAINSVLNQDYQNVQVVIVDDNNPDTEWRKLTSHIMKSYVPDSRVKYICHEKNMNGSAARNTGIENSDGELLCFLDDDDWFLDTKVEKQSNFLEKFKKYAACCCDYKKDGQAIILQNKEDYTKDILLLNMTPQTSGIMFRREAITKLSGFDASYIRHQDYELLLRFFDSGYLMGKVNEVLYIRERANNSNIPNGEKMEAVKAKFLRQFDYLVDKYGDSDMNFKKAVYTANYFTLFKCYLRQQAWHDVWRIFLKSCRISSFFTIKILLKKSYEYLSHHCWC